jgi:hypothetical protein
MNRPYRENFPDDVSFWVAYRKWQSEQALKVMLIRSRKIW